jgi:hypothetical protein
MKSFIMAAILVASGLWFVIWLLRAYIRMCRPVVNDEKGEARYVSGEMSSQGPTP